ncbi:MAG: aminodeoxychorismate lyase, partial [Gammaproteobacteria bacterium]|nr:aminodeoxychorismate lyase [Gammaproteobacteria bacterium]
LRQQALSLSNQETRAVIKIIVTRGVGGRGYRITEDMQPTIIMSLSNWPDYPPDNATHGVHMRSCEIHLAQQPRLAGIKHLNRLEQILARREWSDESIAEGSICDAEGHVIEGTMSNLFFIQKGVVITPELSQCGVAGIMRQLILEACAGCGVDYRIIPLNLAQARLSEEIFMTNSLIEVWPVRQWDDKTYIVNGEITQKLKNYINKKP